MSTAYFLMNVRLNHEIEVNELKHILLQKIKPINHIQYAMTMMVI